MSRVEATHVLPAAVLSTVAVLAFAQRRDRQPPAGGVVVGEFGLGEPERSLPRLSRRKLEAFVARRGDLRAVDLRDVRLDGSVLAGRDLTAVDASHSSLRRCDLRAADLTGARLDFADLSNSDLTGVDFTDASLVETTLWDADLSAADLSQCRNLVMANLRRARFDDSTRWPPGFEPLAHGAVPATR